MGTRARLRPLTVALIALLPACVCAESPHGATEARQTPALSRLQRAAAEAAFDSAAARHRKQLRDLYQERGIPAPLLPDASLRAIVGLFHRPLERDAHGLEVRLFPEGTVLLFYAYDGVCIRAWVVNGDGILAYERLSTSLPELRARMGELRAALGVTPLQLARAPRPRRPQQTGAVADDPARGIALVGTGGSRVPLETAVQGLSHALMPGTIGRALAPARHLIVTPCLDLGTVPFSLLEPGEVGVPLVATTSVAIAPSLFDLGQRNFLRNREKQSSGGEALVIGNPDLSKDPDWVFPPLPGAEAEAKAVAGVLGCRALVGRSATKAEFLRAAPRASVLYLASHGVSSSIDPMAGSFIGLSGTGPEETRLTAKEVQSMDTSARIAILSACQTGLGRPVDAGLIGLARAFQIAGVPYVAMSLWNVDDEATAKLMLEFVRRLNGTFPSEALRQAMVEIRKECPDPAKWASFTVFGVPSRAG